MITLKTNQGDIVIELDHANAPKTSENFTQYVREGFYDGVIFHRVISNFMIQGGGFEPGMSEKTTRAPIENEAKNGSVMSLALSPWLVPWTPTPPVPSFLSTFQTTSSSTILDRMAGATVSSVRL